MGRFLGGNARSIIDDPQHPRFCRGGADSHRALALNGFDNIPDYIHQDLLDLLDIDVNCKRR
jgi:hypothetical protein